MKTKNIITISNNGEVYIPTTVTMRDFEIAELLGVILPTIKGKIKKLLKSRPTISCSGGIVMGNSIIPECFGLDMVIALSFRVQSRNADTFRKWIMAKMIDTSTVRLQPVVVQMLSGQIVN